MKEDAKHMDGISFTVAEEIDAEKAEVRIARERKFTGKKRNGNSNLAATEGLKRVHTGGTKRNRFVVIDDEVEVDVTRIRKLSDVTME